MGICCAKREQIFNIQKFNVRRRESFENKNLLISSISYTQSHKRNSIYIYNNEDIYKNYDFEQKIFPLLYVLFDKAITKGQSNGCPFVQ